MADPSQYADRVSADAATPERSPQREWWLRALLVFQSPRPVFAALRDDSDEVAYARQEPVVAFAYLAAIAGVLGTQVAGKLLDDPGGGLLVVLAWAFFAGGIYALAGLWVGGFLLYLATRWLGGQGSRRRSRHLLAFALAPLALSLLVVWPLRLALYGRDVFRVSGADENASGTMALDALQLAFVVWSAALLVVGTRALHGWGWVRAVAGVALAVALPALVAVLDALA